MFWLLAGILVCSMIVFFSYIQIFVHYSFDGHDHLLKVNGKALFGLISIRKTILPKTDQKNIETEDASITKKEQTYQPKDPQSRPRMADEENSPFEYVEMVFGYLSTFYHMLKNFFKRIKVRQLIWTSEIGTGDAATTGIATGASWAVKGNILAMIRHYFLLETKPQVNVFPDFQNPVLRTNIHCMIQVQVGQTIIAGIKAIRLFRKLKKEQTVKYEPVKKERIV